MNFLAKSAGASPTEPVESEDIHNNAKHVVIVGAGPSGLLLTALLLKRNESQTEEAAKYKVTLVESQTDLGLLDPETELKAFRSWMIALASHGLEAVREIPELYEHYVKHVGVPIRTISVFLGSRELKQPVPDTGDVVELFIVDRNFVCAAIARYLNDKHSDDPYFERMYQTKLLYVDYENHQIFTRKAGNIEEYTKYDLLVGCDGIRSIVREALVRRHYDFELEVGDIFHNFKAVHIALPKALDANTMTLIPDIFPHMQAIALPEKDGNVNISMGASRNKFEEIPAELKSNDPTVVAKFMRNNLKGFELEDYDDFAKQWVECRWNRTGMVQCNFYHSVPCKIVLMGDAVHATSPSIGMGMNTALRDAQKFAKILETCDNVLEEALAQYSKERVKEGNSLTQLAYNLYCHDTTHQMIETGHTIVRGMLHSWLPSLVSPHPQMRIGFPAWSLSDVYQLACDQGIIQKHRQINKRIRQEFFELQSGMITRMPPRRSMTMWWILLGVGTAVAAAYYWKDN